LGRVGLPHFWSRGVVLLFFIKKSHYFFKNFLLERYCLKKIGKHIKILIFF